MPRRDPLDLLDDVDTSTPILTREGPRPIGSDRPIDLARRPRPEPVSGNCPGAKGKPCGKRLRSDSPPAGPDGKRRCGGCTHTEALHPCPGCKREHLGDQPYCRRCRPNGAAAVAPEQPAPRPTLAPVPRAEPRSPRGPTGVAAPPPAPSVTLPDVTALPIEYLATCVHELRRRLGSLIDSLKE